MLLPWWVIEYTVFISVATASGMYCTIYKLFTSLKYNRLIYCILFYINLLY